MARIAGVDIPREKRVDVSLRYIFGIGATAAKEVLEQARIDGGTRVRDLTEPQVAKIREIIDRGLRWRVTFAVRSRSTSSASRRSGATAVSVTGAICPSAGSG